MPKKGYKQTKEHRRKLRELNRNPSKETLEKRSNFMIEQWKNPEFRASRIGENHPQYGKHRSEETKRKLKEANSNPSEETIRKIKEGCLKKWADPVYYKRMCEIRKKTFQDPILIKKLSDAHTGKILSEKNKRGISKALKGKPKPPRSVEHCENLRKSMKGRHMSQKALESYARHWREKGYISKPERLFGATMTKAGIHYTAQFPIRGIPDFFVSNNICIFCDGNYWHCNPSMYDKPNHSQLRQINSDYWVNKYLRNHGYIVLRFWEYDINNRIDWCIRRVKTVINTINRIETPNVILLS